MTPTERFLFQNLSLYRMRRLSQWLGKRAESVLAEDQKIRLHDWRVLAIVEQQPQITATRAGPEVLLNKMQTSRAIAHLADLGLLKVLTSDADGRALPLELSAKGRKVLAAVSGRMAALEMWALSALDSTELAQLGALLGKIERQVKLNDAPTGVALDQLYEVTGRSRRVAYLFARRGDA